MNLIRRPLSKHRRARLIAWTLAMLTWLASTLAGAAFKSRHERQRASRMSLKVLSRRVQLLIISRAVDFVTPRRPQPAIATHRGRSIAGPGALRAVIGSRLRRLLKCKSAAECVVMLLHALRHLDGHAWREAKRMKRGLTRRWPTTPKPARCAPALALAAPAAFFADSS